jgi:glycosyltransferase involved in cell wall biosynthesis
MKKILICTLHRPGRSPSQRFRFEQYLDFLRENGFSYEFSYLLSPEDDETFYSPGNYLSKCRIVLKSAWQRLKEIRKASAYDIIFVQREAFMLGTSFFERKFGQSKAKFIFDFDDAIWLQNVSAANKKFQWLKNPEKTAEITSVADLILVGNQYLEDYAKKFNANAEIVPTTIDTKEYDPTGYKREQDGTVCIGWSGSITTIQHFKWAKPFLKKIKDKYGDSVTFKVIGDENYGDEELGVKALPWRREDEIREISSFDIGIMPLPDDEWARGKCGLKGLQYMALNVPTIMSPVGINNDIIQDNENGYLADEESEWLDKLTRLIESPELRNTIGKAGRQTVIDHYSFTSLKHRYLTLFNNL